MESRNGRPELVSLLQYMKETRLDNPEITVKDRRIIRLDEIVTEVKQSEEWEDVRMTLLEYGIEKGIEQGIEQGIERGIEQGIEQGIERGIERGIEQGMIKIICRKLCRGESAAMIAEDLEEDYGTISEICEIAGKFAPQYDYNMVCEEYFRRKQC